jgi:hypothetical protein
MARLDRLGDAREIAQIAAVIGRQFTLALLDAVASRHGAELETALATLVAAEIVFPEGRGLERSFSFKHALVRDAAYESLLLARRREWHERVARALEQRFPELTANEPELLAYHFGEAGLAELACNYRLRAGERAVSRSAYQEAIAHFSAGLKMAERLSDPAERMRRELDFLLKLGPALGLTRGMQSQDAEEAYRRAAEISEKLANGTALFRAKWGLWLNANLGRKTARARERAGELVMLAERSGDDHLLLEAYHCSWSTAIFRGDIASAIADGSLGIERYDMNRTANSPRSSAAMIRGFARMFAVRLRCKWPATGSDQTTSKREGLRSRKLSTIQTRLPTRSTMLPCAISWWPIAKQLLRSLAAR